MFTGSTSSQGVTALGLVLLLALHSRLARADATWLYPPSDGLTFYYKDVIAITYENNVSWTYLATSCILIRVCAA